MCVGVCVREGEGLLSTRCGSQETDSGMIGLFLKLSYPSMLEGITRIHSDLETEAALRRGGDRGSTVAFNARAATRRGF